MKHTGKNSERKSSSAKRHRLSPLGHVLRFIGWWFGFAGLYGAFSVCPFCGQQACPVGFASAGAFGAFFALLLQDWRRFVLFLKERFRNRRSRHRI